MTLLHKIQTWQTLTLSFATVRGPFARISPCKTTEVALLSNVMRELLDTIYYAFTFFEKMRISAKVKSWNSSEKVDHALPSRWDIPTEKCYHIVLQSLNEFYEDARHEGRECPHEAEFRAYYLITHLRDSDTIRQMELLPQDIFHSEHLQAALRLHALAQRNNESRGERGRRPANSEASLNAFSRFFKAIASDQTSYLLACLAETHFADIRRGALVCLRKAYMAQHPECPLPKLTRMLGCDDAVQCADITQNFGFAVVYDDQQVVPYPIAVILHRGTTMTGELGKDYEGCVYSYTNRTPI